MQRAAYTATRNLKSFNKGIAGLATLAFKLPPTPECVPVLRLLQQSLLGRLNEMSQVDLLYAISSFAKASILEKEFEERALRVLAKEAPHSDEKIYFQYLTFLMSLPSLNQQSFTALEPEIFAKLKSPLNIAKVLSTCNKLKITTNLFKKFEGVLVAHLANESQFVLSMIVKAYAEYDKRSVLFRLVSEIIMAQAVTDHRAVAAIVSTFGFLKWDMRPYVKTLFTQIDLSALLIFDLNFLYFEASKTNEAPKEFLAKLEAEIASREHEINASSIAFLSNAIAMNMRKTLLPMLLERLRTRADIRERLMQNSVELAKVMHALAKFRVARDLVNDLSRIAPSNLESDSASIIISAIMRSSVDLPSGFIERINYRELETKRLLLLGYYLSKAKYFSAEIWKDLMPHYKAAIKKAWDINSMTITNTLKNLAAQGVTVEDI
jgi:hypothetical protein